MVVGFSVVVGSVVAFDDDDSEENVDADPEEVTAVDVLDAVELEVACADDTVVEGRDVELVGGFFDVEEEGRMISEEIGIFTINGPLVPAASLSPAVLLFFSMKVMQ